MGSLVIVSLLSLSTFSISIKGLDAIYYLTRLNQRLTIYLEAHDGETRTANYSAFHIDADDEEYRIHVSILCRLILVNLVKGFTLLKLFGKL